MTPNLYGICMTKNEADIITLCLSHASRYCKKIFVLDNGSTDNTWDLVNAISEQNDSVVPFERKICQYGVGLKGYIFNKVRNDFRAGDWIMVLDSDEFLETDPTPHIRYCEQKGLDIIYTLMAQFYITRQDWDEKWFRAPPSSIQSFKELPRHYLINFREPRLFRYQNNLEWPDMDANGNPTQIAYPRGLTRKLKMGVVNRHYQYRSLPQMKARIALRSALYEETGRFKHSQKKDYRQYIRNDKRLKKSVSDEVIKPDTFDYFRLYLIRRSKKFKRFFQNRTMDKKFAELKE